MKIHFLTPVAFIVFMALSGIVDAGQWGGGTSLNYQLNQLNQLNQTINQQNQMYQNINQMNQMNQLIQLRQMEQASQNLNQRIQINQDINQINQMNQMLDMQQQIAKQKKARVSPATTHTGQSKHKY